MISDDGHPGSMARIGKERSLSTESLGKETLEEANKIQRVKQLGIPRSGVRYLLLA
jgi:hypothetical protein